MPIPLGIFATAGAGGSAGGPAFELISTTVLGSPTTSITFSSIPATYKHLQIRGLFNAQTSNSITGLNFRLNGSSSVEYNAHYLRGDGGSVYAEQNGADVQIPIQLNTPGYGLSTVFSALLTDILDYASTSKNKTLRSLGGTAISNQVILGSGLWINTAAINSVTLFLNSGISFTTGTRVSLYGIKG